MYTSTELMVIRLYEKGVSLEDIRIYTGYTYHQTLELMYRYKRERTNENYIRHISSE